MFQHQWFPQCSYHHTIEPDVGIFVEGGGVIVQQQQQYY
jgi:hypothetical protein